MLLILLDFKLAFRRPKLRSESRSHSDKSGRSKRTIQERAVPQERAAADSGNDRGKDYLRATTQKHQLFSKRIHRPGHEGRQRKKLTLRARKLSLKSSPSWTSIFPSGTECFPNLLPFIPCVLSFSLSAAWRWACTSAAKDLWPRRDLMEVEESVCAMRFLRDFSRRARFCRE
jgi:hypothetical protein